MACPDQVVLSQGHVRTIRYRCFSGAPLMWQRKACVNIDDVRHGGFKLGRVDVLGIESSQRLRTCNMGRMAGGLARAQIAAIAKDREKIALHSAGDFWIASGRRPKMAYVARPVFSIPQNVEQMRGYRACLPLCASICRRQVGTKEWSHCSDRTKECLAGGGVMRNFTLSLKPDSLF